MLQHLSHICNDPIGNYMDDLCIQNSHPLASCEFEDRVDNDLVWQPASLSCSAGVSLLISSRNL